MVIKITPAELIEVVSAQRDLIVSLTERPQKNHVKILR